MSGSGPNGNLMSGTEIVANEAATVLHGIPLRDGAGWVNVLLIIVLGCAGAVARPARLGVRALVGGLLAGLLYVIAAQITFDSGWIVAVIDPEFALVVGIVGTLAVVYLGEAFERQYARSTFARFVPPGVVDEVLASTDEDLRLAGVQRVCTVMFSDLRGFTQVLGDPAGRAGDRGRQPLPQRDDRSDPRRGRHADRLHGRRDHGGVRRAAGAG